MTAALFDPDPELDALPSESLLDLAGDDTAPAGRRGRAMVALGRRGGSDPSLIHAVVEAIDDPRHRGTTAIGTTTLSHLGVAGLFAGGSGASRAAADALVRSWPPGDDRDDLLWLLRKADVLTAADRGGGDE